MVIKEIINGSELHYTASKLIDEESFEKMVDELTEAIEENISNNAMKYIRYLKQNQVELQATKDKMKDSGWINLCIEPNFKTFIEFCKEPEDQ